MNMRKNARLTPLGRERLVGMIAMLAASQMEPVRSC